MHRLFLERDAAYIRGDGMASHIVVIMHGTFENVTLDIMIPLSLDVHAIECRLQALYICARKPRANNF